MSPDSAIETAEQLAQLRELKCGYGQGYFFSQSLSSDLASGLCGNGLTPLDRETERGIVQSTFH